MPRFEDFLNLTSAVYGNPPPSTITVDGPGGSQEWAFLMESGSSSQPGYYGAAYLNSQTNEIILVNRGTNDLLDIVSDAQILLDKVPDQRDAAEIFYNRVASEASRRGTTLSITGHSLGGSLTQLLIASHANDPNAVFNGFGVFGQTFNALGVKGLLDNLNLPVADYAVTNWVVPTDVVGNLAEHIGDTATLSSLPFAFTYLAGPPGALAFLYDSHQIDDVLDNFNTDNAHPLLQETEEFLIKTYVTDPGFPVTIDGAAYVGGNNRINVGNELNGSALNDLMFGGLPDDRIHGGAGSDVIYAGAGHDTIWGDAGADIMLGEQGNDTYVVDDPGDRVIEVAGEGTDTVESTVSYTLSANVEQLILQGSDAINGTGNELANVLIGNNAANVLDGGLGADSLAGGGGGDTLLGGAGFDTYSYATGDGQDTISDSQGVILYDTHPVDGGIRKATDAAGTFHGGAQGAMTYVLDGATLTINNLITVQGFQNGNLGIHLTTAPDTQAPDLQPPSGPPTIDFSNSLPERTEYWSVYHFHDGGFNFRTGVVRVDLVADGGYHYFDDPQNGQVPYEPVLAPADFMVTSDGYLDLQLGDGGNGVVAGPGADHLVGGMGSDFLFGEGGNDQFFGGEGDDQLEGFTGDDFLQGDEGDDHLNGQVGNDVLLGGEGDDQIVGDYSFPFYSAGFDAPPDLPVGQDWLDGGVGDDILVGGGGNDMLLGGDDN